MPALLLCADPLKPQDPDSAYQREAEAAIRAKLPIYFLDFEALVYQQNINHALKGVPEAPRPHSRLIYRGWMMKPRHYRGLYEALQAKGWQLINSPAQYRHTHYLPEAYALMREYTPRTVWMETGAEVPMGDVMVLLELFGKRPVILRDYAKSQKFYWDEACYIPAASDAEGVERVVKRFVELQGEDLNKGLVFREFVKLEPLGILHAQTGQPLYKEWRIFWLQGQPMYTFPYWDVQDEDAPILDELGAIGRSIQSNFFTMDVAKKLNSDWIILELGDGQVAGLPAHAEADFFYQQLNRL